MITDLLISVNGGTEPGAPGPQLTPATPDVPILSRAHTCPGKSLPHCFVRSFTTCARFYLPQTRDPHLGLRGVVKETLTSSPHQRAPVTNGHPGPQPKAQLQGRKDTIICLSEGDVCLNFSSFSSCLISLFRACLHFLISAYRKKEGCFLGLQHNQPQTLPAPQCGALTHPRLLYLRPVELQGVDHLHLQPLDLGEHRHAENQCGRSQGDAWRPRSRQRRPRTRSCKVEPVGGQGSTGRPPSPLGLGAPAWAQGSASQGLGQSLHLAEPRFLACKMGIMTVPTQGWEQEGDPLLF